MSMDIRVLYSCLDDFCKATAGGKHLIKKSHVRSPPELATAELSAVTACSCARS
jgi:hypothetical protein